MSLTDRVWLKVKTSRQRGGVTSIGARDAADLSPSHHAPEWFEGWWLGFAGVREDGSAHDVYAAVLARSRTANRGHTAEVNTRWLLPTARDARRAIAEFAAREEASMRGQVLAAIVESAVTGMPITTVYGHHALTILVRVPDNLTYLAIGMVGVKNHHEIAALLACVPGVDASSWGTEPGGVMGLEVQPGQLIYSTALEPSVLASLMQQYPPGTLRVE